MLTPEEDIADKIEVMVGRIDTRTSENVAMYTTEKVFEIMKSLGYTDDENFENQGWGGDFESTFSKEGSKVIRYSGCWYYGKAWISLD